MAGSNLKMGLYGVDNANGISSSNPFPVTVVDSPVSTVTSYTGQAKIATTGTAVQLSSTSYIMQNGITVSGASGNNTTGGTIGNSSVTNTVNGTGNGNFIAPGATVSMGAGINLNSIYVNGTSGDIFYFGAS